MATRRTLITCLAALALSFAPAIAAPAADTVTVLAAASLTEAMSDIAKHYEAVSGKHIALSFAGSMILAKQIEASTGADLFVSADQESMDYLDSRGLIQKATRTNLLGNALVLIAPADSNTRLAIAPRFPLAEALKGGRLAVANVDAVPAGRYAKAALTVLAVWDSVAGRLAQGEDVRATLAYVARGETALGIVYSTDAKSEAKVRLVGTFPENSHPPIIYPAALTKEAKPGAATFLDYLKGSDAGTVFEKAGFTVLNRR